MRINYVEEERRRVLRETWNDNKERYEKFAEVKPLTLLEAFNSERERIASCLHAEDYGVLWRRHLLEVNGT